MRWYRKRDRRVWNFTSDESPKLQKRVNVPWQDLVKNYDEIPLLTVYESEYMHKVMIHMKLDSELPS